MKPTVLDWATDYDIFDAGYVADPFPIWDGLRARRPGPGTRTRPS